MFTSPQTVVFMRCGHSIHYSCYKEHMLTSFKCPICSRSIINMEMSFRNLDRAIDSQPMPPQFRDTKALVYCNDCCARSSVQYHWLGLKCAICDSYNTAQLQILSEIPPNSHSPRRGSRESSHIMNTSLLNSTNVPQEESRGRTWRILSHDRRQAISESAVEPRRRLTTEIPPDTLHRSMSEYRPSSPRNAGEDGSLSETAIGAQQDDVAFWGDDSPAVDAFRSFLEDEGVSDDGQSTDSKDEESDPEMAVDTDADSVEEDPINIMGHL